MFCKLTILCWAFVNGTAACHELFLWRPDVCLQSAAALCVGVGSFSDPKELPGLAHFLEHSKRTIAHADSGHTFAKFFQPSVLFSLPFQWCLWAAKSFPKKVILTLIWRNMEEAVTRTQTVREWVDFLCNRMCWYRQAFFIQVWLSLRGMCAITSLLCSPLQTVFYFDVTKDNLKSSLDRFAQFFVNPLMRQDSVDREIKAVDSGENKNTVELPLKCSWCIVWNEHVNSLFSLSLEFDMALTNDHHRKEQLLGSLAREDHPMSKFMWGTLNQVS